MPEQQSTPERAELIRLHAATCLSMTRFIHGHHCPKLAQMIVHQLSLLIAHPELELFSASHEMYQQLLEHWQKVTAYLMELRGVGVRPPKCH